MPVFGIILGILAAMMQSVSYIFTRLFVIRRHRGVLGLLTIGHVIMGAISAVILPLIWVEGVPSLKVIWMPLVGSAVFYLLGQMFLFLALRHTDASSVAPFLTMKIVVLAVLATLFDLGMAAPTMIQWSAAGLSVAAAFILNYSGVRLKGASIVMIVLTCLSYSLSDLSVFSLMNMMKDVDSVRAVLIGVCMCYVLCGIAGAVTLPVSGRVARADLAYAFPFAITWLLAMGLIFACMAQVKPVYANIIQSTRGLFSILLGGVLASMGMVHLESKHSKAVFARRVFAALLMCAAIGLYGWGKPEDTKTSQSKDLSAPARYNIANDGEISGAGNHGKTSVSTGRVPR